MNRTNHVRLNRELQRRRSWSAPAAPLRHIGLDAKSLSGHGSGGDEEGASAGTASPPLPPCIYKLFGTRTRIVCKDILPESRVNGIVKNRNGKQEAVSNSISYNELKEQLEAATYQIKLLNDATRNALSSYASLKDDMEQLQQAYSELKLENAELRENVQRRDDEIDEQLHMICKLQLELEKSNSLAKEHESAKIA